MERRISRKELQANNGEPGRPRCIAFDGVVYDVSDCPNWQTELHRDQHFAGQDLTAEINAAPHGEEALQRPCVRRVGLLIGDDRPPLT